MEREEISRLLLLRARGMAALRGVLQSSASRDFLALLELLVERTDPTAVARTFGRLWEELALEPDLLLPDAWRAHLVGRLLDDENPFTLGAERGEASTVLLEQVRRDLRTLQELFDLEAGSLLRMVEDAVPGLEDIWVPWTDPGCVGERSPRHALARKLAAVGEFARSCSQSTSFATARAPSGATGRFAGGRVASRQCRSPTRCALPSSSGTKASVRRCSGTPSSSSPGSRPTTRSSTACR